jgi:hypothetical protein
MSAQPTDQEQRLQGAAGPASPEATRTRGFVRRHWLATTVVLLIAIPTLVFTLWAGIALSFSYSEGTRTGFVQKLSRKGWICKTWEGEMAMTAQPGVAPTIFQFTVRDDSVAMAITAVEGRQVTLDYEEHQGVPTSCFGETGHFVTGVRVVER